MQNENKAIRRVLILQPNVPTYRARFFTSLIELGVNSQVDYLIYSGNPKGKEALRSDFSHNQNFTCIRTLRLGLGSRELLSYRLPKMWRQVDLVIAEHAIRNTNVFKWCYLRRPMRFAFWGHGRTYTKIKTGVEESLKMRLLRRADWYFAYTEAGARAVTETGFPKSHVTVVQNSTDTSLLQKLRLNVKNQAVEQMREELGLGNGPLAVFIGGLDESKRLEFIVEVAGEVAKVHSDFKVVFFGAGSQQSYIETQATQHDFIVYGGRADAQMQAVISRIASFILMPGRVGLIAVDSFALELPIVTTDWPLHAPEFDYLVDSVNAIITEDNQSKYVSAILDLLSNPQNLDSLKSNCAQSVKEYSIENMAMNFHQGVLEALAMPPRKKWQR